MKKYHIYGIGNALVDVEIEVTEQELADLAIEKGVMTLVDDARLAFLMDALSGVHHKRACGGSAANTVIGASKLGANCFYSCKIANDETGQFYADDLHREGVVSNLGAMSKDEGDTGKCLVMVTADADRTMNTFLGITGDIGYSEVDEAALRASEWLYLEGYLVSSPSARAAAIQARAFAQSHDIKVALSLSDPNMVRFFKPGLEEMIGSKVDFLFCNRDEALMFADTDDLTDAIEKLKTTAQCFAITLGSDGSKVWTGEQLIEIQPFPVIAIDTNGAGDLFAGAFLYGLTHGLSFENAGTLASFASSLLVTEFGPRLSAAGLDTVRQFQASMG